MPFGVYGYLLNRPSDFMLDRLVDLVVITILVTLIGFYLWWAFQVVLRVRLRISETGGEFRGMGSGIRFTWADADHVDYVFLLAGKSGFQLSLILNRPDTFLSRFSLPRYFTQMLFSWSDSVIPLDILRSYGSLNTSPPSPQEMIIFFQYFLETELGHDILRFAPHVFSRQLGRYIDDESLN